jgi:sulfonate transport system ATP-binding protein
LNAIAIRIRGLVKRYGGHTIFDGLELDVAHGDRLAVLGASGCGKSTLLRCIAGLESWDGGEIDVAGEIGYVFQEPRLFGWLDVERNVAFAARNAKEKARVPEVLALVGMTSARAKLPKHLSGGMAQRAAIARALVRKPEVLLFDEPLASLDALTRLELRASLHKILTQAGATAVWVTHDVEDAVTLATRTIVLQRAPNFVRAVEPAVGVDVGVRRALLAALGVPA